MPTKQQRLNKIINFVHSHTAVRIHLTDHLPTPSDCTWAGICLTAGEIYVDLREPFSLGSVLHEVGHVIGTPLPLRPLMHGFLTRPEWLGAVADHEEKHGFLAPISEDGAATFWACMVLDQLKMPLKPCFEEGLLSPEDAAEQLASHNALFKAKNKMSLNGQVQAFYLRLIPTKTALRPDCWDPFAAPDKWQQLEILPAE